MDATADVATDAPGDAACGDGGTTCGTACVSPDRDINICGACGRACSAPRNAGAECVDGRCTFVCNSGFGDCDGDTANGCETSVQNNILHCGRCHMACPRSMDGEPSCFGDTCELACPPLRGDCDRDPRNGCEAPTASDRMNCGFCGSICDVAQNCVDGICQ